MKEREINQDKEEVGLKESDQGFNQQDMMDKLFVKMQERLEEKYKQEGPKREKPLTGKPGEEIEETLHEQVMSNTCPICFELFLPPEHSPFILFPCGHSFCKQCIDSYAKIKKKCPFCRSGFNSMAPNISL